MRKMTKNFTFPLLIAILFSLISSNIYAAMQKETTTDTSNLITMEQCQIAGEKWLLCNYNDGTEIRDIIPIKSLDETLNAYCINYVKNSQPNGYLVLNADINSTSFIREFALDGNGIYEQLLENCAITTRSVENVIYSTNPFEYAIKFKEAGVEKFYNSNSIVMLSSEQKKHYLSENIYVTSNEASTNNAARNKTEYSNSFFSGSVLTSYQYDDDYLIMSATNYTPYIMSAVRNGTNSENCGPTAVLNIVGIKRNGGWHSIILNESITDTYADIVTKTGFNKNGTSGITYAKAKSGLKAYVESRNFNITINDYWFDRFSDFKEDFDDDKMNLMYIRGYSYDSGSNSWEDVGHFIVGIGYRIMEDGSRYIRVCDGWNATNNRFLNFDSNALTVLQGTSVEISKY